MPEQKIPFLKLFSAWQPEGELAALAAGCNVTGAVIDRTTRSISARVECPSQPADDLRQRWERSLADAYQVGRVALDLLCPQSEAAATPEVPVAVESQPVPAPPVAQVPHAVEPAPAPQEPVHQETEAEAAFRRTEEIRREALQKLKVCRPSAKKPDSKKSTGKLIFGRREIKGEATEMKALDLDMGTVIVKGDVFAVEHKELKKRGAWVIGFDMTDYTGSIHINKFCPGDEGKPIVDNVKEGMHLLVQGKLTVDRFSGEMVLEPYAIMEGKKESKQDNAPEKRVELHLHTTMSSMDALTPTKAVVKRAEGWGHRAIAITDHGVAQSFPDAWHAAKNIKVL